MDLLSLALCGLAAAAVSIIFLCMFVLLSSKKFPSLDASHSERVYKDEKGQTHTFPSLLQDLPSRTLTVVVPAYNEHDRLPVMLDECLEYLEQHKSAAANGTAPFTYEVIVVDDGSVDDTSAVAARYTAKHGSDIVRVLTLARNRGKGGAVRMGMLHGRGELMLFADADGASKFEDYAKLEAALGDLCEGSSAPASSLAVVCGSRAHLEEDSVAHRSVFRTVLMYGFHSLVWLFTVRGVRDTQCGFKLFTRRTARILFQSLHIERWAFDVELLVIAQTLGIPISEVAVRWTEIDGSKVTPVLSWLEMGRDLLLIWLRYRIGAWKIRAIEKVR